MRAGWESWRACLLWGIATLLVSQAFALIMPAALAHPIPGASIDNPVLAFEFARTPAHLDAIFGALGDPLREARIAGMIKGNLFDYLFMVVYGSFVLAFFGATAHATGERRWWLAGWLGPLAAVSDGLENALLLSITSDIAHPARELAWLPYPVWTKFTLLAVAAGLAGWALIRQRGWPLALLCIPAPIMLVFGLLDPLNRGQTAVGTIAPAWIAMLAWAAWRWWRERGLVQST